MTIPCRQEALSEQAIVELFKKKEYDYFLGENPIRDTRDVLLYDNFRDILRRQYHHVGITESEISTAIAQLLPPTAVRVIRCYFSPVS